MSKLRQLLELHEGRRAYPYFDCCGKPFRQCQCLKQGRLSIGVGRNIEDDGLTEQEIDILLDTDIDQAECDAEDYPWAKGLSPVRRDVVLSMLFNLGQTRFERFQKMIGAIGRMDFHLAAQEMLNSLWANQTGQRAVLLAEMMWTDKYPEKLK
jgi:lysozyme